MSEWAREDRGRKPGNKKWPERERKKERSESKLIKMTAELWMGGKEEGQISFHSRRQICVTCCTSLKPSRKGGMHTLVRVSIQSLNQNCFLHITLLYKHKTVTSAAGGDVWDHWDQTQGLKKKQKDCEWVRQIKLCLYRGRKAFLHALYELFKSPQKVFYETSFARALGAD